MISASSTNTRLPELSYAPAHRVSLRRILSLCILALAGLHLGVLVYHAALSIAFPYDLDYGEGYVLFDALRLAQGHSLYTDITQFPMVRSPYPPLFPALLSLPVRFLGPVLWPGRLLAAASLAGIVLVLGSQSRRVLVDSRALRLAVPAVFLASPFVYQWTPYARVDFTAVFLAVAAVAVAQNNRSQRGVAAAAVLCLASLWTKQTSVAAPIAIGLFLLSSKRPRQFLLFVAILGVPSAGLAAILNAQTDGEFWRHVVEGNSQNPFNGARVLVYSIVFLLSVLPLLATLGAALRLRRRISVSPAFLYCPLALLTLFSVGNEGSSVNYFLEPLAASVLVLPFALSKLGKTSRVAASALVAAQLLVSLHIPNGFGTDYLAVAPHGRTPTSGDYAAGAALDQVLRSTPGEAIVEPAALALRNGKSVYLQPIDLRAEQLKGRWHPQALAQALERGDFPTVITAYNLLPHDIEHVISAVYAPPTLIQSDDGLLFQVYRYAPSNEGQTEGGR